MTNITRDAEDRLPAGPLHLVEITADNGRQTCGECDETFNDQRAAAAHARAAHRGVAVFGLAVEARRRMTP